MTVAALARILVVDDEMANLRVLCDTLRGQLRQSTTAGAANDGLLHGCVQALAIAVTDAAGGPG